MRRLHDPFSVHPHLTPRDRVLLRLLEDHQVLLGDQIGRVLFSHRRTCQLRLDTLRSLGLLDRFRFARPFGGSEPWKWVLGLAGARFQAAAAARPSPTERAHREHVLRLSASPALPHLLATNEFFIRLQHSTRTPAGSVAARDVEPQTPSSVPDGLLRWWPERVTTARFSGTAPDGHAIWKAGDRTIGLFLECDLGTENLTRLTAKLTGYARLADAGGPRYPVLFWLPSTERETNLQRLLRAGANPAGVSVATATHGGDPAGPVWMPSDGWQRVPLHELTCDHGPHTAANPNWREGFLDLTDQRQARP